MTVKGPPMIAAADALPAVSFSRCRPRVDGELDNMWQCIEVLELRYRFPSRLPLRVSPDAARWLSLTPPLTRR